MTAFLLIKVRRGIVAALVAATSPASGFADAAEPPAAPPVAARDGDAGNDVVGAAALILDDSTPRERREELIARHKGDAAGLLRELTKGFEPGTPEEDRRVPWIWRVAVAAGRRDDAGELAAVLDASLPAEGGRLLGWQAVAIGGGVVNGISLTGAWPAERIEAVLRDRPDVRKRWDAALEQSAAMADDEAVIPGTRYDALRMAALRGWGEARPVLERYLGHENVELQQGAVSGLGDARDPEAARLLLASLGRLSEANRGLALDALVRDAERMRLLLDAVEAGTLSAETLGEDRVRKLREAEDAGVRERAARLP